MKYDLNPKDSPATKMENIREIIVPVIVPYTLLDDFQRFQNR